MPSAKSLVKKEAVRGPPDARRTCCLARCEAHARREARSEAAGAGQPPLTFPLLLAVQYDVKLSNLLETYSKCFLVHADNVGSKQFMDIRAVRIASHACRRPAKRQRPSPLRGPRARWRPSLGAICLLLRVAVRHAAGSLWAAFCTAGPPAARHQPPPLLCSPSH
jgi:hypothetical protein